MTEADLLAAARSFVAKWRPRMHLNAYLIRVVLDPACDAPASYSVPAYDEHVLLTLRPSVCADLRASYPVLSERTDAELLETAVVHELAHVVVVREVQVIERHLHWLCGKKDAAAFFDDLHAAWRDLEEAVARRMTRLLLEADRGAWAEVQAKDGALD